MRKKIKNMRQAARRAKLRQKKTYDSKIAFLIKKYKENEEDKLDKVPREIEEYAEAKVFGKRKFDEIEEDKIEVSILGEISLTEPERKVMRLHPKFAILKRLDDEEMEFNMECGFAKARMEIQKEEDERIEEGEGEKVEGADTGKTAEELEEIAEEIEARGRQIFDPEDKIFDHRKKRATDVVENARVTLPRPLSEANEATISMMRSVMMKTYREYKEEYCDKNGNQKTNMTEEEES